jgi:hypothetical protein
VIEPDARARYSITLSARRLPFVGSDWQASQEEACLVALAVPIALVVLGGEVDGHREFRRALQRALEAAGRRLCRTKLERAGQREQHAQVAGGIVGSAIAQRNRNCEIGPRIVAQKPAYAAANRNQGDSVGIVITGVPSDAAVHEAIELVPGYKFGIQLLVEPQLQRAGHAVVAAGLGRTAGTCTYY